MHLGDRVDMYANTEQELLKESFSNAFDAKTIKPLF